MFCRLKKYVSAFVIIFLLISGIFPAFGQQGVTRGKDFYVYDTTVVTDEVFFKIKYVNRFSDDSIYVTIESGTDDGLFMGATGNIMSSYPASEGKNRKSNVFIGSARIVRISPNTARAVVRMYKDYQQEQIYPLDLLAIQAHPVVNKVKTIFSDLAELDIIFQDNSKEDIKSKKEILNNTDQQFEKNLMIAYTKEITDFYDYISSLNDTTFTIRYKTGPYKGQTMAEVFKSTTYYDLNAFFQFVKTWPGRYMGKSWKIIETFATWLFNNAPPGEKNSEWIIPLIEATPLNDLGEFVKKTAYFIREDTLILWTKRFNDLQTEGKTADALSLCDKLIFIAQQLRDVKAEHEFYYNRSFLLETSGRSNDALADVLKAFQYDRSNLNYKYALASQYGKMEQFEICFKLYEEMKKEYPGNTNILGNYGWYKLAAGQVDEATPYCRAAYFGDPLSVAFTVNYAHTFMLKGKMDSAMYYYQITMDNLYRPSDYTDGPKADFILFFRKGWERKHTAEMAEWMDKEFNEKYYAITRGNEVWDEAKAFYDKTNYLAAVGKWKFYLTLFDKTKNPPHSYIHNANTWIATSYWFAKMYDSAAFYYSTALSIAKQHLVNGRNQFTTKDNDRVVEDYDRLFSIYSDAGNTKKAEEYKLLHDAEAQKVTELYSNPAVHVIALGGNNNTGASGKANASLFYETFTGLKKQNDKQHFSKLLSGENLTKEKLTTALEEVRKKSKPEDIFIFYYAGESLNTGSQSFLTFNEKDTVQGRISVAELMDNLDLVYANKKMLVSDLPNPSLLSLITSRYINIGNSSSEIIFLSPGVETPVKEKGVSLFTSQLVATAQELQKTGSFSAKDFVDKASYAIGRGQHYLPVLTFAYGKDFLLFENKTSQDDINSSVATRGLIKDKTGTEADAAISGPQKNYALLFATDLYKDNGFNKLVNPINDAKAMQKILQNDFGFDVQLVINPTRDDIEKWLSEYRDNKRYGPNDQLMIFFAGHGVYYDKAKMGYLVANDSKTDDPTHKTYLSYSDLGNIYLKNISCNRIFLVLDACFAGSFFDNTGVRGNPSEIDVKNLAYLKRTSANQRFYKGISSGGKQYVEDGKAGQHSPFAGSFMRVLFNKSLQKSFVTADEIIGEIKSNPPGNSAVCEGNFNYSDPLSHFIFELKNTEKVSDIKAANLK